MKKIINILFFFICIFLIFNNVSKNMQVSFIGGILFNKLSFYPFIIGFLYTIYHKYKWFSIKFNIFLKFILICFIVLLASTINGLYNYPYYNLLLSGPITQIERLPEVINLLKSLGIDLDIKILIVLGFIIRTIKGVLFDVLYTFGGAYMIYYWYHYNWKIAFKIVIDAVKISLIVIFLYNVIEICYLSGNENATSLLKVITPYFHIVYDSGSAWPPLLWPGQLRSIFSEPSYYGIYFAFAMPLLWYITITNLKIIYQILLSFSIIFFTFCLFLTQARTAVLLFFGELLILVLLIIYLRNKTLIKRSINIFICVFIAFVMSNIYISNIQIYNTYNVKNVEQYIDSNISSLVSTTKRSNNIRYSNIISDIKIGLDYPLFGVGNGLRNAYKIDYFPNMAKDNEEIKRWVKRIERYGILTNEFPRAEYTSRFAETGIVGLVLFLIPPFILLHKLYLKITDKNMVIDDKLPYVFFTISLIGIMTSGLGDSINITFCYWVLLGLGYAMCFEKTNNKERETNHE